MFAGIIDGWKNRGLTPDQVPAGEAASFANGKGKELYAAFQERLKILNAADFGDLLLEQIRLFRENPDVLGIISSRFRYILVDEYQDTNVAQYLWLRLLGQSPSQSTASFRPPSRRPRHRSAMPNGFRIWRHACDLAPKKQKNICCVGDDDQSIYGWRGAEVDNILRFEKDFPGARSFAWNEITAPPATSSPPPRTSSRITKAASAKLCAPRTCRARRSPSPAPGIRKKKRAPSARRSSSFSARAQAQRDRHPGARLVPDARIRRPFRHARPALSRHRRPALL